MLSKADPANTCFIEGEKRELFILFNASRTISYTRKMRNNSHGKGKPRPVICNLFKRNQLFIHAITTTIYSRARYHRSVSRYSPTPGLVTTSVPWVHNQYRPKSCQRRSLRRHQNAPEEWAVLGLTRGLTFPILSVDLTNNFGACMRSAVRTRMAQ
jgi:hypothetical protein